VAKLVRCQGRHDEQMSLAQQVERSGQGVHYSLCNFGTRRMYCNS
jgi:hypothetical protein